MFVLSSCEQRRDLFGRSRQPCWGLPSFLLWPSSQLARFYFSIVFTQVQLISVNGSNRGPEIQVLEAFALPEGDPVYEVAVRGSGWQKEVQEIRAVATPTSDETEIQVCMADPRRMVWK